MKSMLLAGLAGVASATLGVDVSQLVPLSAAKCMVSSGYSFAVVRGWCSFGGVDGNMASSVANLWAGGMAHVDVYAFPCRGQSATTQMNSFVDYLNGHGVKHGMVWLDIETNPSPGCSWGVTEEDEAGYKLGKPVNATLTGANCDYIGELVSALKARGQSVGVYASQYMWGLVAGSGCTVASSLPLWYAHYDGNPSFSDFVPFGGWGKPAIKQFNDGPAVCGVGADHNFY